MVGLMTIPVGAGGSFGGPPSALPSGVLLGGAGAAGPQPISASPTSICSTVGPTTEVCRVDSYTSTLSLGLNLGGQGTRAWPAVQMLFLGETTIMDGFYRPATPSECASTGLPGYSTLVNVCNSTLFRDYVTQVIPASSNLLPTFVNNSYEYTEAIQAAHPLTRMTFGFLDFFATGSKWDPGGGHAYHVDVSNFLTPGPFSAMLNRTFVDGVLGPNLQMKQTEYFTQNWMSSDVIQAMYGALTGVGINWSPDAHHVLVWIGGSMPQYQPRPPPLTSAWWNQSNDTNVTRQVELNWLNYTWFDEYATGPWNYTAPIITALEPRDWYLNLNHTMDACVPPLGWVGEPWSTFSKTLNSSELGSLNWDLPVNFAPTTMFGNRSYSNLSRYRTFESLCFTSDCAPSYEFAPGIVSPRCEGWVTPTGGTTNNSIAVLARTAPTCVDSLGGNCTIDVLSTGNAAWWYLTPQVAYLEDGGGPYGLSLSGVYNNTSGAYYIGMSEDAFAYNFEPYIVEHAGCSIAEATGGTWDGSPTIMVLPSGGGGYGIGSFHCQGTTGNLPTTHGQRHWYSIPHFGTHLNTTMNASFLPAFEGLGLGQPTGRLVATAAFDRSPMLKVVLEPPFVFANPPDLTVSCSSAVTPYPLVCTTASAEYGFVQGWADAELGWNLSSDPNENFIAPGESIQVTVQVIALGVPASNPAVADACVTSSCRSLGVGARGGEFTSMEYGPEANATLWASRHSYGPVEISVFAPSEQSVSGTTPPTPAPPPPPPLPVSSPPILTPVPGTVPGAAGIASPVVVSSAAIAAGLVAAGVTQGAIQPQRAIPIAIRQDRRRIRKRRPLR